MIQTTEIENETRRATNDLNSKKILPPTYPQGPSKRLILKALNGKKTAQNTKAHCQFCWHKKNVTLFRIVPVFDKHAEFFNTLYMCDDCINTFTEDEK